MIVRRVFRPPLWATVLTPVVVAACVALGFWQLGRGDGKAQLREQLSSALPPTETLSALSLPDPGAVRRAIASGEYLPERTLLLEGQSHAGQAGYHIWTPFRLADGALALVDRGWLPRAQGADPAPPPTGVLRITGYWRTLPEPGLRLAESNPCPPRPAFPAKVLYPTAAQLECILDARIVPGLLLLDAAAGGGFVRDWKGVGVSPQRHYAYAAQWLALAALAAALYVLLNLKRMP